VLKLETTWRGLAALALAILGAWILFEVWTVILLVIVAFIFMAALLPYVELFVRWRIPRAGAVLLVLFIVLAIIGGLFAVVVPAMVDEFQELRDNAPEDLNELEDLLSDLGIEVELSERFEDIDWGELISGRAAIDYGQRVVFGVISAVTVIVLTAYLLNDAPVMKRYLFGFIPPARHEEADRILQALERVVGGYLRGQAITSGIIGVFTTVVLLAVGVDNAIAFGVVAAFADIIPLIGAFIAIIPAVLAAFTDDPTKALIVLIALLLYQQFEDRYLVPRVYGSTLGLQPLVVLVAVLVGAELLGITGVLLALPAAAAGKVFLDYYLEQTGRSAAFTKDTSTEQVGAPDEPPRPGRPESSEGLTADLAEPVELSRGEAEGGGG
jgi:predicted PurR-regulated permease PerM